MRVAKFPSMPTPVLAAVEDVAHPPEPSLLHALRRKLAIILNVVVTVLSPPSAVEGVDASELAGEWSSGLLAGEWAEGLNLTLEGPPTMQIEPVELIRLAPVPPASPPAPLVPHEAVVWSAAFLLALFCMVMMPACCILSARGLDIACAKLAPGLYVQHSWLVEPEAPPGPWWLSPTEEEAAEAAEAAGPAEAEAAEAVAEDVAAVRMQSAFRGHQVRFGQQEERRIQWLSYYLKVGGYDEAMGLCALDEERRAVRLAADASAATAELSVAEYKATALF